MNGYNRVTGFFAVSGGTEASLIAKAMGSISHRAWDGFLVQHEGDSSSFPSLEDTSDDRKGLIEFLTSGSIMRGPSSDLPVIVGCLAERSSMAGGLWLHGSTCPDGVVHGDPCLDSAEKISMGDFEGLLASLSRVDGAFAFISALPDGFVFVRDALGVKPLYYSRKFERFGVATEPKALRSLEFDHVDEVEPGSVNYFRREGIRSERFSNLRPERSAPTLKEAAERVLELLKLSIRRRLHGLRKVAISFSGGLDSSLLAYLASEVAEVILVSIHAQASMDEKWTKEASSALGLPLETVKVDVDSVSKELPRVKELTEREGKMDLAIASALYLSARRASELGIKEMVIGQLADELFGGYAKYVDRLSGDDEILEMMRSDVFSSSSTTFPRDDMATSPYVTAIFPYASLPLVRYALSLPLGLKIERKGGTRKIVLREAAKMAGLPLSLSNRAKKAVQYSSGIMKMVRILAS